MFKILTETVGIGFRLSMFELLQAFTEVAKSAQLFIQQPSVAALIYAANAKPGCFTGFY